jgi:hypothetical protein
MGQYGSVTIALAADQSRLRRAATRRAGHWLPWLMPRELEAGALPEVKVSDNGGNITAAAPHAGRATDRL